MKLIIDIPKELAEKGHWYTDEEMWTVIKAAQNGTPIPDNATNGDVIKAIFPQWKLMENTFEGMVLFDIPMKDGYLEHNACSREWWNTPYQKGGKE